MSRVTAVMKWNRVRSDAARHRWSVASRVLVAAVGGYGIAALATADLSLLLPRLTDTPRAEAVLTATLWSFAVYAVVVMGCFTARSARRAWIGAGIAALALGLPWLLLRGAS